MHRLEVVDCSGLPSTCFQMNSREAAGLLLLDVEPQLRALDRGLDLRVGADDAFVLHQPLDVALAVARDLLGIEIVEGFAEVLALAQDRDPGEPRLKPVEDQLFVERARIVFRHAPFFVVIGDVERVLAGPGAADCAVAQRRSAFFFILLRRLLRPSWRASSRPSSAAGRFEARGRLRRRVQQRLDLVAVEVVDEGAVIARAVIGRGPGSPLLLPPCASAASWNLFTCALVRALEADMRAVAGAWRLLVVRKADPESAAGRRARRTRPHAAGTP